MRGKHVIHNIVWYYVWIYNLKLDLNFLVLHFVLTVSFPMYPLFMLQYIICFSFSISIFSVFELKIMNRSKVYGGLKMRTFHICMKRWRNWRKDLFLFRLIMFWGWVKLILALPCAQWCLYSWFFISILVTIIYQYLYLR